MSCILLLPLDVLSEIFFCVRQMLEIKIEFYKLVGLNNNFLLFYYTYINSFGPWPFIFYFCFNLLNLVIIFLTARFHCKMAALHRKNKYTLSNVVIVIAYYFPTYYFHVMIVEILILKKKCKHKIQDSFVRQ